MRLTTAIIKNAMTRHGGFEQEYIETYHGGELYREETYSEWFRFKPGDWLVADVRSAEMMEEKLDREPLVIPGCPPLPRGTP